MTVMRLIGIGAGRGRRPFGSHRLDVLRPALAGVGRGGRRGSRWGRCIAGALVADLCRAAEHRRRCGRGRRLRRGGGSEGNADAWAAWFVAAHADCPGALRGDYFAVLPFTLAAIDANAGLAVPAPAPELVRALLLRFGGSFLRGAGRRWRRSRRRSRSRGVVRALVTRVGPAARDQLGSGLRRIRHPPRRIARGDADASRQEQ